VSAGSLLLNGEVKFEAACPGSQNSLRQIIALIEEALSTKNRFEVFRRPRHAGPWCRLCCAVGLNRSLPDCLLVPPGEAFLRALTVLVITCPCALGIATPLARVAEIGRARASANHPKPRRTRACQPPGRNDFSTRPGP